MKKAMNILNTPDILTLEEVATYLRLPVETILKQALNGRIPGEEIEGNWWFSKAVIDDWLRGENHFKP
jgi:excisionase family DNA binding protein